MTEQEIVEVLDDIWTFGHEPTDKQREVVRAAMDALEELQHYRAIGTVEELQKIKEKITPSKSFVKEFLGEKYYQCPVCCWMLTHGEKYCNNCGQALDWSE